MKIYNNSFSFGRVGLLVKRDVIENWKTFLFLALVLALVFLLAIFACARVTPAGEDAYMALSLATMKWYQNVFTYYCIFVFSGIMANMQMQGERTNFLMLPASNLEKFLGRLLYVVLLTFIPYFVAILFADVLHMLIFPFIIEGSKSVVAQSLLLGFWDVKELVLPEGRELLSNNFDLSLNLLLFISCILSVWEISIYVLGGCYWRKHPFVKTLALIILFTIVVAIAFAITFVPIINKVGAPVEALEMWMDKLFMGISQNTLLYICAGVYFVWTILNFYMAYRLFCRSQVVEPKRFKS